MFNGLIRHRPKYLTAVYVEPHRIEVLRAHRQWRSWKVDSPEQFTVSEGETIFDSLQRLNLRPRGKQGSALVLFLPGVYYSFHRELYPSTLQDRLDEALTYDWQENVFYEHDRTLHFFSFPVLVDHHISVPIFSIQRDLYEKFQQVLGSASYQSLAVVPSALAYGSFLRDRLATEESDSTTQQILARMISASQMEVHRFYNGRFLDSLVVNKGRNDLQLFRETMKCFGNSESQETIKIEAICASGETVNEYAGEWQQENLPIQIHSVPQLLVSHIVRYFLKQDEIRTFDAPLLLKPWEIPKIAYPLLVLAALFLIFATFQFYSLQQTREESSTMAKQIAHLEAQWKPIEQLQTRISKFQEDQKTLSEFKRTAYPLMELLTLLTRTTPDDTWLNYVSLRSGQLILRGESKSAIKYLSDLSKIEGFSDVRFASPVTRNPSSDFERFNVQLQVDVEKLNKTVDGLLSAEKDETKPVAGSAVEPDHTETVAADKPAENIEDPSSDNSHAGQGPAAR